MAALSLRLPDELGSRLSAEARLAGVARSDVARTAIEDYLARAERERFMTGFVAEARAAYEDPSFRAESLQLAAEALETDNEALAIAENSSGAAAPRRRRAKPGSR